MWLKLFMWHVVLQTVTGGGVQRKRGGASAAAKRPVKGDTSTRYLRFRHVRCCVRSQLSQSVLCSALIGQSLKTDRKLAHRVEAEAIRRISEISNRLFSRDKR